MTRMGRPKKMQGVNHVSLDLEDKDFEQLQTLRDAGYPYRQVMKRGIEEILRGKGMI